MPDERFWKAVFSLAGNPEFEIIREHFKMKLANVCGTFHRVPKDQTERHAGKASALEEIVEEIKVERAMKELDKLAGKNEKKAPL
jgi:hypothetical protein